MVRLVGALAVLLVLLSCSSDEPVVPNYFADSVPELLADWGQIDLRGAEFVLGDGVMPYEVNTPLFTDYAHKLRTVWVPEGAADYREGESLEFPVGSVFSKTFYYPRNAAGELDTAGEPGAAVSVNAVQGLQRAAVRLIETRLLVHRPQGWVPLSYVWNEAQTEARYRRTGAILSLALRDAPLAAQASSELTRFPYVVPNENQCAGCHATNNTTAQIRPIGPSARQLNLDYPYAAGARNQLQQLALRGWLTGLAPRPAKMVAWDDPQAPLTQRARAYLDANCAHCHNPVGPADTSGLHLNYDNDSRPHLGWCKNAIAAGPGTGGRSHDLVPGRADDSILVYRMQTRDPAAMMPELGRSLPHREGIALIRAWINREPGGCS